MSSAMKGVEGADEAPAEAPARDHGAGFDRGGSTDQKRQARLIAWYGVSAALVRDAARTRVEVADRNQAPRRRKLAAFACQGHRKGSRGFGTEPVEQHGGEEARSTEAERGQHAQQGRPASPMPRSSRIS
jgi:hypothetical protein